ncbi:hypothetical protein BSLG_000030 [Batrachochytrium salamandrivorans]|nr:hypothetical protein BSLG_000030 [Batrachochytrium salamandrivorans]
MNGIDTSIRERQPLLQVSSALDMPPHSPAPASVMLQDAETPPPPPAHLFTFPRIELFSLQGSVIPTIFPMCAALTVWAALWSYIYMVQGIKQVSIPNQLIGILSRSLGRSQCLCNMPKKSDWTDVPTTNAMQAAVAGLLDCLGTMERIGSSPIPMAYLIHLKQTLYLYLLSLPFQLVSTMGWTTVAVVGAASFTLLGIEAIGGEIENPFGYDPNDLKLDKFCRCIQSELREMLLRAPLAHDQDVPTWTRPVDLQDRRSFVALC